MIDDTHGFEVEDLDSLLKDSMLERQARKESKPPREKRTGVTKKLDPNRPKAEKQPCWMSASEKAEFDRQVNSAEARAMWRPTAAVAMFSTQICLSCGSSHTHFEGFFQHQIHKGMAYAERWIVACDQTMLAGLPKQKKITIHEADTCMHCAALAGFLDPSSTLTEPSYAAWTPHKNHQVYSDQSEYPGGFVRSSKTSPLE